MSKKISQVRLQKKNLEKTYEQDAVDEGLIQSSKTIMTLETFQLVTQEMGLKEETARPSTSISKTVKLPAKQYKPESNDEIQVGLEHYILKHVEINRNRMNFQKLQRGVKYSIQMQKKINNLISHIKPISFSNSQKSQKKYLILDLDQTLIFSQKKQGEKYKNKFVYIVNLRPYVQIFLKNLSKYYEIFVFTAAEKGYASMVIGKLNKNQKYIKGFLSRQHCILTPQGRFIKDLRLFKDRKLKDIVIVDNLVQSFALQLYNGIPILDFRGEEQDTELPRLMQFLIELSKYEDVRVIIKQRFKLNKIVWIQPFFAFKKYA